jgi:NSS family neurotransmitter:Na+ symporter
MKVIKRETFSNQLGFIFAAAGSAVGLGNIWRFPYLAARYGGGTFLIVYILLVLTFGFTLMVTESALGRKTRLSSISAFSAINKKFGFVGYLAAIIPIIITPYYFVIGGWVLKYCSAFLLDGWQNAAKDGYFGSFVADSSGPIEPVLWFVGFGVITCIIICLGVKNGVERASRILMPLLIIFLLGITIFSFTTEGILDGLKFYFIPDFTKLSANLFLAAMGQMFYSMSLAMGIMITYGSYMKGTANIEVSVKRIEMFDMGVAILAGLMIVPTVYVMSGGDQNAVNAGPSMMFVTMPKLFASMGFHGHLIGTIFFILVLFAALTSAISLMETVVSIFADHFHLSRIKACIIAFSLTFVLGIFSALGFGLLDFISIGGMTFLDMSDFITNAVLMPVVALLTCIFIGFIVGPKIIIDELELNAAFKKKTMYITFVKYIAPIFLVAILISSILNALGIIKM